MDIPINSKTKNKWFKDEIKQLGINKKSKNNDVAIFEDNELFGFEEIIGQYMAKQEVET
jgi:hypothetical protein